MSQYRDKNEAGLAIANRPEEKSSKIWEKASSREQRRLVFLKKRLHSNKERQQLKHLL
ncbi:hypothetical protein NRL19_20375 [Aeromonas caviae]|jgi:hypothetical protein|uniref:hypothetical protein n=1 Tax=Aeromonas caviae TaxID=648 RepID=UPI0024C54088|nr:hypothetical protein NRL19_20375 [Aeromonas caviae]